MLEHVQKAIILGCKDVLHGVEDRIDLSCIM